MATWGDTVVRTAGYTQGRTANGGRPTMTGCPPTTTSIGERGTTAPARNTNITTSQEGHPCGAPESLPEHYAYLTDVHYALSLLTTKLGMHLG